MTIHQWKLQNQDFISLLLHYIMLSKYETMYLEEINYYLKFTKDLRRNDNLIVSYKKPHKAVKSAISRSYKIHNRKGRDWYWKVVVTLDKVNFDDKVKPWGFSSNKINKAAGWKETSTFRRFYNKTMYKTFFWVNYTVIIFG